jgi:hypothetical protein
VIDKPFHQIAFACYNPHVMADYINNWSKADYNSWTYDVCVQTGLAPGLFIQVSLAYNYDILPGMELELVHFSKRWKQLKFENGIALSHMAYHVHDVEAEVEAMSSAGHDAVYKFVTRSHTNPQVVGQKRFKEAIFDTSGLFGFDIKAIQRIPWDSDESWA